MRKKLLIILMVWVFVDQSVSQEISLSQGLGGAVYNGPFDGVSYYSAINIRYRYVSISPVFVMCSYKMPSKLDHRWHTNFGFFKQEHGKVTHTQTLNSFKLFINLYPFQLFNEKSKHFLMLGLGYGLMKESAQDYLYQGDTLESFDNRVISRLNFAPQIAYYRYFGKTGIGIVIGKDGAISEDGTLFATLNISVRL